MKKIKILIAYTIIALTLISISACGVSTAKPLDGQDEIGRLRGSGGLEEIKKISVCTTLFPQYDFAKQIGKDRVQVSLLLPPGVEAHSYEPTPRDIANIKNASVFIYTGKYMEPWAEKIIEAVNDGKITIVDASKGIELLDEDKSHVHDGHFKDGHHSENNHPEGIDPHIWLDPLNGYIMVNNIVEGLVTADPDNEGFYRKNGEEYKRKLQELDEEIVEALKNTKSNTIIYSGHFAFGYFAKRYGLEYISPYKGFAPDSEPTPKSVAELIKRIEEADYKVIFYEEFIDPKVARVVSEQTGAEMLMLHALHNVSKEDLHSGATYIKIMKNNLEKLKRGLGYYE